MYILHYILINISTYVHTHTMSISCFGGERVAVGYANVLYIRTYMHAYVYTMDEWTVNKYVHSFIY